MNINNNKKRQNMMSYNEEELDFPRFDEENHQTVPSDAWFN